jgi:hypothetical protein
LEGDDDMMDMGNAVTVPPGKTKALTWRFDNVGEVLFGCHEPGHYEGGMVGSIEVSQFKGLRRDRLGLEQPVDMPLTFDPVEQFLSGLQGKRSA